MCEPDIPVSLLTSRESSQVRKGEGGVYKQHYKRRCWAAFENQPWHVRGSPSGAPGPSRGNPLHKDMQRKHPWPVRVSPSGALSRGNPLSREPSPQGHATKTISTCSWVFFLPECWRQVRRRASSKRIYFTTDCSGRRRAPELDSSFVVIWIMICSCMKLLQWFCCVIIYDSNMCGQK